MAECEESQTAVGEELKQLFQLLDTNHDGSVDMAEMCNILSQVGEPMSTAELAEVLREADLDGDGKLNYDEFIGESHCVQLRSIHTSHKALCRNNHAIALYALEVGRVSLQALPSIWLQSPCHAQQLGSDLQMYLDGGPSI